MRTRKPPPTQRRRTPAQRRADALERLIDAVLDRGPVDATGGIARPHLSVDVDAATLHTDLTRHDGNAPDPSDDERPDHDAQAGPVAPDDPTWAGLPTGTTAWGDILSPQTIRRLLCDGAVSRIVVAGRSQVLDVGRTTRSWSEPQRRGVNARDRGCRGPGCTRPIERTQVHHLQWWTNHGSTAVANGLALCHHCHHLVHHDHWTVHLDPTTAVATWRSPHGRTVTTRPHHTPPHHHDPNPRRPTP